MNGLTSIEDDRQNSPAKTSLLYDTGKAWTLLAWQR